MNIVECRGLNAVGVVKLLEGLRECEVSHLVGRSKTYHLGDEDPWMPYSMSWAENTASLARANAARQLVNVIDGILDGPGPEANAKGATCKTCGAAGYEADDLVHCVGCNLPEDECVCDPDHGDVPPA